MRRIDSPANATLKAVQKHRGTTVAVIRGVGATLAQPLGMPPRRWRSPATTEKGIFS